MDLRILYEDEWILGAVKPQGMPAQADKTGDVDFINKATGIIKDVPTVEMAWISVEERLPDIGEHHVSDVVLCYCKDGVYAFSELEENIFGQKCFSCERDDEYHCNPLEVIAWMPLPKFNEENET